MTSSYPFLLNLISLGADKMSKEICRTIINNKLDGTLKRKLRRVDELLIWMMALRFGLLLKDLDILSEMFSSAVQKASFPGYFFKPDLQGHHNHALNLSPTSVGVEKTFQDLIQFNFKATLTIH